MEAGCEYREHYETTQETMTGGKSHINNVRWPDPRYAGHRLSEWKFQSKIRRRFTES